MPWWDLRSLSCLQNLRGVFQGLTRRRSDISAVSSDPFAHIDFPLIDNKNKEDMREVQLGSITSHTVRSHGVTVARTHMHDWLILILLVLIEGILYIIHPFYRFVGEDMMTDLKYPLKSNTVPVWSVPVNICRFIAHSNLSFCILSEERCLRSSSCHSRSLILCSNNSSDYRCNKNAVGRPRPDFFWRCFPDGKDFYDKLGNVVCHGDKNVIKEGHKSFPSGHTSWSFAGLGFLSLYLSGKIKVFDRGGHVAKLCIVILPLLFASLVGISRVDDYWHHWQDVFAGGLLGLTVATFCYLQFFPPPYHNEGWGPYAYFRMLEESRANTQPADAHNAYTNHTTEAQMENQEERSHHGCMGLTLARNSSTTLEEMESGRS
ncbi:lipid phosphate phosphatase 2-like [Quillaja saponaria]|uniref:Lipid phosphate phosphatase 2-like n=1 Tax=Quillaja saponaria TaxID=32244 RepID=A0AAD7VHB9_QUISA|nr:lipid phosphate phosphatase 2-like [Quillaja saponaria]